ILGSLAVLVIAMFPAAFLALNFQRKEKVLQPSEVIIFHRKSWLRLFIILSCFGYLVIFSVVPLLALIIQCGDVKVFIQAVRVSIPEAFNSLVIASGCALLAGLLPWAAVCGGPRRHSTIWEFINLWAIGVSPLVIALVCSRIGSMFGSRISSITIANAILCYALLLRVWPYAFRTISSGHEQYHADWKATAQMARVPKIQQITKIGLPHYLPYVGLSMVLAFSLSIGEIEISQMLCAPGYGTLALRLMTFLHFAPANEVAGLALFQMLIALTPIFVGFACYKKLFKFL
ncbi:MAG: hypothetical protein P8K78_03590, partial [Pirellulales bacterium]|nr:hypothetical protein [Pirellulales bacterium]